ncbi:hypothetical protein [Streptomyces sp. NPDC050264]|uniref:hypothetical protein n=1 Tax=Streptomyces sp. NPDC050264 TaxID=3155038 RepID=UPI00344117E6
MNAFKKLVTAKPTLWFLFLFNLVAAAIIPLVNDGPQGVAAVIGMGAVSLKAGIGLLIVNRRKRTHTTRSAQLA